MPWNKWIIVAAFGCATVGCRAPQQASEPRQPTQASPQAAAPTQPAVASTPPTAAPPATAPPPGLTVYRIDPDRSQLRLLVYRSGPLARLGHDHVILARGLSGWIAHPDQPAEATFYLRIPADEFVVDDDQARALAGPQFAAPVDDEAKDGTRHNLLGAAMLDAAQHPSIEILGTAVAGTEPDLRATVLVRVAGHDSTQVVPFRLLRSAGVLTASADFPLRQTDLGLTPFSVMMGALRVEDEIHVNVSLVASAQ